MWVVMPCSLMGGNRRFGRTLVTTYKTTRFGVTLASIFIVFLFSPHGAQSRILHWTVSPQSETQILDVVHYLSLPESFLIRL